jgi:hypothetical protein
MPTRVIRPGRFIPTASRSGDTGDDSLFRMQNLIIQGLDPQPYATCYGGSLSLSETIATSNLTGTIALTANSTGVVGSGTAFTTQLHLGQFVLVVDSANNRAAFLGVLRIISDTSFICASAPTFSTTGKTGVRLPILFPIDIQRGTAIWGNVIRLDKGTLISVGDGTFRLNGSAISSSLSLTRAPKISLFNSGAGTYTNFTLGMTTPAAPTVAALGGGSPGMQAGSYSIVITPARTETDGYNNPSPRADVTLAAGDKMRITFPAMDTTNGQNAWIVWGTLFSDSLGADKNYLEGPWHRVRLLTSSDVNPAGGTYDLEWLDAQIERNELVTFNNDQPSAAEFVVNFNNVPVYISCQGTNGSSPGPFIIPAKPGNIEAAPLTLAFSSSPPEIIYGVTVAVGRLYLLTSNHLQVAQATPRDDTPVLIQPFWQSGFTGPDQVVFAGGRLYGYPVSGPTRSASEGVAGSEEKAFAADVEEITESWIPCHVRVADDPSNEAICFFHVADSLNSSGFWTTKVLMFGLRQDAFIGYVDLSSTTGDMIVTSAKVIGTSLQFLAGGRQADNSVAIKTYQWDTASGSSVSWRAAPQFSDNGSEQRNSLIKGVTVTANVTSGSFGVFGSGPTEAVPVSALATGNSASLTGAVSLTSTSNVSVSQRVQVNVPNVRVSTVQVEGVYSGTGTKDRLDEVVIEHTVQGVRN